MRYSIYLLRFEQRITVSSDGTLRSARSDGKSYHHNDVAAGHERIEVREGMLLPDQLAELESLFVHRDSLSTTPYGGVPDGGDVSIRYGNRTVSGGSAAPHQASGVRIRLMELARAMPVLKYY